MITVTYIPVREDDAEFILKPIFDPMLCGQFWELVSRRFVHSRFRGHLTSARTPTKTEFIHPLSTNLEPSKDTTPESSRHRRTDGEHLTDDQCQLSREVLWYGW